jgi:hypothetical protein
MGPVSVCDDEFWRWMVVMTMKVLTISMNIYFKMIKMAGHGSMCL